MAKRKRPPKVVSKRGRPRKVQQDGPTPEAMAKKLALVAGGDPALSAYPLGVLLARKLITQDQHDAGIYYAYLAGRVLGKIHPGVTGAGGFDPEPNTADEIIESKWREACARLKGLGRGAKDAVDNVAVYQRFPSFLFNDHRRVDIRLRIGLQELSGWWLQNGRRAA